MVNINKQLLESHGFIKNWHNLLKEKHCCFSLIILFVFDVAVFERLYISSLFSFVTF